MPSLLNLKLSSCSLRPGSFDSEKLISQILVYGLVQGTAELG